ncbi:MAG: alpha/beta fold hydrolase [Planctomycetota bacterium]
MSKPNADRPLKRRRWLRAAKWLGVVLLVFFVVGAGYSWRLAGKLLAPSQSVVGEPPDGFPAENVSFASQSGSQIAGWYQRGKPGRGAVLVLHGIRGNRLASVPRAKLIAEAGFSTLVIDFRCHGESPGERVTLGFEEKHDVLAAIELLRQRHPGEPIGVVGFSLGGAAAALGAPLGVDALVLEAVYPTIDAAVANRTSKLGILSPVASFALLVQLEPRLGISRSDLRPVDALADVACPVMIVGGGKDQHTTPEDTRRMFAAAPEPKQLVWFADLAHNNFARWRPDHYRSTVVRFLRESLGAQRKPPGDQ